MMGKNKRDSLRWRYGVPEWETENGEKEILAFKLNVPEEDKPPRQGRPRAPES